jgi:AmpD protein
MSSQMISLLPPFSISVETGLLLEADYRPSPHYDARPDPQDLSLVVIHGISLPPGQFGGEAVSHLFLGTLDTESHPYYRQLHGVRVSAHLFIRRTGEVIQFVPFHQRAWHAGVSRFGARHRCNDYAIGIELEGTDTSPYTEQQYACLSQVLSALRTAYPSLFHAPVVGHADIASLRKTDPGSGFVWSNLAK